MKKPQVTVLMPVYNAGRFLAEAIESILNQTFRDFEFLIIDDGSTDESLDTIKKFARQDDRIKVASHGRNKGLVATLNKGLSKARGEFIARQDADDMSLPTRLEEQIDFLRLHPDVGLLGANLEVIDKKGQVLPRNIANIDLLTSPDDLKLAEVFSNQFGHGSIIAKANILKGSTYDPKYKHAEDYELWSRLMHKTNAANLKKPLYLWRLHEQGVTASESSDMRQQALRIASREFEYYLKHKPQYRFFSFHPFSMRGGVFAYLARKNSVYRDMALMYVYHGQRRRAIPILLFSILHSPWKKKSYRYLYTVLRDRQSALELEYELF